MDKKLLKRPQIKYNFETIATKFKLSSDPIPLGGKYIYRVPIQAYRYKWFYAPVQALDMYFVLKTEEVVPVLYGLFIPTDLIVNLVVIRPVDWTSGFVFFQYFLSNSDSKDFQIFDLYEDTDFTIEQGEPQSKIVRVPFPTYNFKFLFTVQSANPDYDLQILQYYYKRIKSYQLENKDHITEKEINNFYLMDKIGGSGAETDPNYPFPSWHTYINIKNNAVDDMTGCYMKVISWL